MNFTCQLHLQYSSLSSLVLSNLLCLWLLSHRLQGHSSFCFWYLIPGGWGWFRGLCRIPVGKDCCLHSGGWSWVFSLRWAGPCPGGVFEVSMSLAQFQAACLLMGGSCVTVLLVVLGWGIQHLGVRAVECNWVLVLRWKTFGRIHAQFIFPWSQDYLVVQHYWTWFSYIERLRPDPGWEPRLDELHSTARRIKKKKKRTANQIK